MNINNTSISFIWILLILFFCHIVLADSFLQHSNVITVIGGGNENNRITSTDKVFGNIENNKINRVKDKDGNDSYYYQTITGNFLDTFFLSKSEHQRKQQRNQGFMVRLA